MSGSEKINLSEIANISEDEFKKQLLAWIDDRGVSRTLQSKLRAELFEHFNRTQLGRQIAVQHHKSHRIELSPLVLVLNTLVAEFLYVENCHFSLSVFSAEVPYKNTLPDFEATTTAAQQPFRLAERELKDIFEAIGMTQANAKMIEKFYASSDNAGGDSNNAIGKSLLYCIFKILFTGAEMNAAKAKVKNGEKNGTVVSVDTNSSAKCAQCSMGQKKFKKYQISSRYFKYLNRYLDILSDRMRDMSKILAEIHSENPSQRKSVAETSAALETNLKRTLDKIIENVNHLTKSRRKSKKLQDFLQSIDRLSLNLETCASNMERLLVTVAHECDDLKRPPAVFEKKAHHIDVDYCTWLQELKTSENGRRFVSRLEASLQKTLSKEQESFEKIYEEKMRNYRMLIKLHYKQKYAKSGKCTRIESPVALNAPIKPSNRSDAPLDLECNQLLTSNALKHAANGKQEYVDRIVETAKVRLQQLENESNKLDKSFQAYLKQQTTQKIQLNEDVTNIWHDYTFGKVLLDSHSLTTPRKSMLQHQATITNLKMPNTTLAAEIDALVQVDAKKSFENPFKQFSTEKLLLNRRPKSAAIKNTSIAAIKSIDFGEQRDKVPVESLLQSISSESSYGQLPSPKRNLLNSNMNEVLIQENVVASVMTQKEAPPVRKSPEELNLHPKENDANGNEIKTASREDMENQQNNVNIVLMPPTVSAVPPAATIEPQRIVVEVEAAVDANNLPTQEFTGADHDSITDDELDESLEISIGPKRDASSSEDVWN